MKDRPIVVVVPHTPGWSYDFTAIALRKHLAATHDVRILYLSEVAANTRADLVVDMWWRGKVSHPTAPVVKQISSHRWRMAPKWLLRKYAVNARAIVVPSRRLLDQIAPVAQHSVPVSLCPKGFHPELMRHEGAPRGPLVVGWAGNADARDKGVDVVREACALAGVTLRIADRCLTQAEMSDFYNACDVIAVASTAEGDPRTLIEGMACGCFPIATDVGIVPELVRDRVDGLIVERSVEAFAGGLRWALAHLDFVRSGASLRAETLLRHRAWSVVAPAWGRAFDAAIAAGTIAAADASIAIC